MGNNNYYSIKGGRMEQNILLIAIIAFVMGSFDNRAIASAIKFGDGLFDGSSYLIR